MVADGQISFGAMLALSLLVGSLAGLVAVAARPAPSPSRQRQARAPVADAFVGRPAPSVTDDMDASPIVRQRVADDHSGER
jgi:hypothetical protein